jgi:Flp pilus assembly protein TadG
MSATVDQHMGFTAMRALRMVLSACRARLAAVTERRFCRNQSGGAAVDFALVLLPFLALLMAIIESALLLFAGQVLQTATTNAARQILTGQVQNGGTTASQFQSNVCANLTVMFSCAANLYVDVRSFASFSSVSLPSVTNANGTLTNNYVFQPGNPGDVVVVRLIYQWPISASALGIGLVTSANNTSTLVATAAFRNEPYSVAN